MALSEQDREDFRRQAILGIFGQLLQQTKGNQDEALVRLFRLTDAQKASRLTAIWQNSKTKTTTRLANLSTETATLQATLEDEVAFFDEELNVPG